MAVRTSKTPGRNSVHLEVCRPDELPGGQPDRRPPLDSAKLRRLRAAIAATRAQLRDAKRGEDEPKSIKRAKTELRVVVDDISWPQRDDQTKELLAARYDAQLPTIVTAGISKAELFQQFGDALIRRCLEVDGKKGFYIDLFKGGK